MLDFLVVTAHPDDESAIAGFLLSAKKQGYKTGIICLTKGESGGFATKEERVLEFEEATALLGFDWVRILDFPDAGIEVSSSAVETLIPLFRETEEDDHHPASGRLPPGPPGGGRLGRPGGLRSRFEEAFHRRYDMASRPGVVDFSRCPKSNEEGGYRIRHFRCTGGVAGVPEMLSISEDRSIC